MWREEQVARAREREKDWRSQQLDDLRRRVAALEAVLGPGGKHLIGGIAEGFGAVLGKARVAERERVLAEVEKRGYCAYRGVWSPEATYPLGSLVTCKGSAWAALGEVPKGIRPGSDPVWQLAVKSGEGSKVVTA
jgi:hypothetical protein